MAPDALVRENSIVSLRNVAVHAATILETLYCKSPNGARAFVEKTAMRHSDFVTAYSFTDSWPFTSEPTSNESRGDLIRRFLREKWQCENLRVSGRPPDHLRLFIQGFYRAVMEPIDVSQSQNFKGWAFMLLAYNGGLPIPGEMRAELRETRDPVVWAKNFVKFYQELSPWPFVDKGGRPTVPNSREEATKVIRDPIHWTMYEELMKRRESNDEIKSAIYVLRELAKRIFHGFFRDKKGRKGK